MHYYKPQDLKLVPLRDLPTGTVAKLARRDDIPFVLRLADSNVDKNRIMVLGGSHSFVALEWHDGDSLTLVVCERDDLRFKLNQSNDTADLRDAGALVLAGGGAYLRTKSDQNHHSTQIDLATFSDFDRENRSTDFIVYSEWELGKLDHLGEFKSIFPHKKPIAVGASTTPIQ